MFRNKTALITGASQGLGKALAIELGKKGVKVVIVARHEEPLKAVVREIEKSGGVAFAIASDLGDKLSIYPLAGQAAALVGPIDILINNASTLGPVPLELLLDTECEDFEHALAVNTLGPFRLSKAILGSMIVRGEGTVVNISSDAATSTYPRWGVYSASKAALEHLTRIWAAELEGSGINIFSVDPGEMNTRMHADAVPDADPSTLLDPTISARRIISKIGEFYEASNKTKTSSS